MENEKELDGFEEPGENFSKEGGIETGEELYENAPPLKKRRPGDEYGDEEDIY